MEVPLPPLPRPLDPPPPPPPLRTPPATPGAKETPPAPAPARPPGEPHAAAARGCSGRGDGTHGEEGPAAPFPLPFSDSLPSVASAAALLPRGAKDAPSAASMSPPRAASSLLECFAFFIASSNRGAVGRMSKNSSSESDLMRWLGEAKNSAFAFPLALALALPAAAAAALESRRPFVVSACAAAAPLPLVPAEAPCWARPPPPPAILMFFFFSSGCCFCGELFVGGRSRGRRGGRGGGGGGEKRG